MAIYPSLYARSPFATRQYLANVALSELQSGSDECVVRAVTEHEHSEQANIPKETRLSRIFEKVNRPIVCGWHDCRALLGSLENLKKHVQKRHCQTIDSEEELQSPTSSKLYRCRYDACQNKRSFRNPHELLEHFMGAHFNSLKLRCPVPKCKHKAQSVDRLAHHISTLHDDDVGNLPQSTIIPLSKKKQVSKPPLPSGLINAFTEMPMVIPNPSFVAPKTARGTEKMSEDIVAMLEDIESDDDAPKSAFARIEISESIDGQLVRAIARMPRSPSPQYDIPRQDDLPPAQAADGPTVGYPIWKRRFNEAEVSGKLPMAYRSSKRRR